ncbi:Gfo/Idh/MocA family protein [Evansella cellulosilytica]|uniref:Oxidoreductase domain protein n=1 Tax=Evansella cellulosilytica (strain ATCC 21833 / DSM 2522 / FERM P-1141 / JCM 9156 / N-4) TaxID=649639 RepID=E6TXI2_EVAC2|nr:Gfo/Idh/MocA family oxidoreductase [Evansella cellulosilytica]ADU28796.1 oxidoreductase domain protein [Evansella cellulosilytica DSM 2522]
MVRFAVIGTNWITESFIQAGAQVDDFQLVAVYSRTKERAEEFAEKYNLKHTYTDIQALAKSPEVDAVYIASPNAFHAEQAITCMEHGKHVLCEKALASNSKEAKEMVKVAKQNQVLLMEAVKSTLLPNFFTVKEHLHKIGKIRRYVASYNQYSSRYDAYLNGTVLNAFNPKFSNGSLMDIGIYCIYPMVVLFGKPLHVKASAVLLESGVDGEGSIVMSYVDMEAVVMYSKITNSSQPSEMQGEKGNIILNNIHTPTKVEINYKDGTTEDVSLPQKETEMYYEVKEFVELIKAGKTESAVNSHENSIIVSEVVEEARKQTGVIYPADE